VGSYGLARPLSVAQPVIDLGYRQRTPVIAAIKGERRRSAIRNAFDADRVTPLDDFYASPTLPDEDRRALGRLHPSFMGMDRIRYRVVDEYNSDTLSEKRTRSSKRPSSEVYPQFEAGIRARIDGWYAEGERLNSSS
jgi:hypothetical protein